MRYITGVLMDNQESVDTGSKIFISDVFLVKKSQKYGVLTHRKRYLF